MIFSSIPFLYYFLPLVLLLYFALPGKLKNVVLLISSLVFYGWGEPKYVFLMIATIMVGYILGLLIDKYRSSRLCKLFVVLSVVLPLAALGYFKYADFFIANFNNVTGLSVPLLKLALPIGISFYTFQILSYTVDVYRGDVSVQKNPVTLATYVALFPQLIAGPIVRYSDVEKQLVFRTHSFLKVSEGISRFVIGICKKILLANTFGQLCSQFMQSTDLSVMYHWLFAVSYMLQVYFDFSGYSDMAIGLGKIFGFDFLENFDYPFISKSISEFWRRWHISLGSWFRDYVYIPLGGNRVKPVRHLFNIFAVWFLTGFWHGAQWTFALWGLFYAILLTVEKYFLSSYLKKHKISGHIYVLILTAISFTIFSQQTVADALSCVGSMFGANSIPFVSMEFLYQLKNYGFVLVIGILGATPLSKLAFAKIEQKHPNNNIIYIAKIAVMIAIVIVATAYLADGSFNPFLYFRF